MLLPRAICLGRGTYEWIDRGRQCLWIGIDMREGVGRQTLMARPKAKVIGQVWTHIDVKIWVKEIDGAKEPAQKRKVTDCDKKEIRKVLPGRGESKRISRPWPAAFRDL